MTLHLLQNRPIPCFLDRFASILSTLIGCWFTTKVMSHWKKLANYVVFGIRIMRCGHIKRKGQFKNYVNIQFSPAKVKSLTKPEEITFFW